MTTSGVSCMTSDTAKSPATLEPKLSDTRVGGGHRACLTGEGVPLIQAECPPPSSWGKVATTHTDDEGLGPHPSPLFIFLIFYRIGHLESQK